MTSDWRGEKRMTSAPKREISKRLAPAAINSMAQQARPMGIGQSEFLRPQLAPGSRCLPNHFSAASRRVTTMSPSIFESKAISALFCIWVRGNRGIESARQEANPRKKTEQVEFVIFFTKSPNPIWDKRLGRIH